MAELVDLAERQRALRAHDLAAATNGFIGLAQRLLRRGLPEAEVLKALTATIAKLIADTMPPDEADELARRVGSSLPATVAFLAGSEG